MNNFTMFLPNNDAFKVTRQLLNVISSLKESLISLTKELGLCVLMQVTSGEQFLYDAELIIMLNGEYRSLKGTNIFTFYVLEYPFI